MPTISEIIQDSSEILRQSGISQPLKEAKSLLCLAIGKDRTFLIAHSDSELNEKETEIFRTFLNRRKNREPFQHISGKQEFWGSDFMVSPDVLIPRPESELIVEYALEILQKLENSKFCEVGVGSGCIAVSILRSLENTSAVGFDISAKALQIASENAEKNLVSDRLDLHISDVFAALDSVNAFDLIVSNPPYIPSKDISNLQNEVRDFDPHIALTDGKDGLSIIEKIIIDSPEYLKSSGFLLIEIGIHQSKTICQMFDSKIWKDVEFIDDLQGIPRMVKAQIVA